MSATSAFWKCNVACHRRWFLGVGSKGNTMHQISSFQRKMLRTPEAATYCGSSASTFEKLRLFGGGPPFVKLGRRVVYDPADLDAWLAANRRRSTSDPGDAHNPSPR